MSILQWLRAHDAGLSGLRRAGRSAIVMPGVFALGQEVIGNPTLAIYSAFGAFTALLLVDFGGPMRARLAAQTSLVLAGAVLVVLGALASQETWLATIVSLVVAFVVLFSGVVSSVLAGASTALLVGFILSVTLPGPVSSIPDRLSGWLLGGAASLIAIVLLWPSPTREPLRLPTAHACALLARRLRAEVDHARGGFGAAGSAAVHERAQEASAAVADLRASFYGTPYRPTGLTTADRMLVRLLDEVVWLNTIVEQMPVDQRPGAADSVVCEVKLAAAALLGRGAMLLEAVTGDPRELEPYVARLHQAREVMAEHVISVLPVQHAQTSGFDGSDESAARFVSSLEPSFRTQEMCVAIAAITTNIELTLAALQRPWWQHVLGRRPEGVASPLSAAEERAGAHLTRHSVWLHNSVRGAIALGLAVLVAELTGLQHSFWVAFGTLAVLRTSALNTGQNALRGLLGTVVGFIIGGALILAIGTDTTVFWIVLPVAVLFAGVGPAISFAAGQAGFTAVLLILYNIIAPVGWRLGLVRIEDVAIGASVSLVVGAIFWPRGALSALGHALADAFTESAHYLWGSIEYGLSRHDGRAAAAAAPQNESRRAAAAARRLDDAFRGFLAERGTKRISMADMTALITVVAVLRLTADAIVDLWRPGGSYPPGDRTPAPTDILDAAALVVAWYEEAGRALAGDGVVPDLLTRDKLADVHLITAVRHDLNGEDGRGTAAAVKMIWTADHIDVVRRVQAPILEPARAAAAVQRVVGLHRPQDRLLDAFWKPAVSAVKAWHAP